MCSSVFVAGIEEELVRKKDLGWSPVDLASVDVDYDKRQVVASVLGLQKKVAVYRDYLGCTLANDISPDAVYRYPGEWPLTTYDSLENWFEYVDTVSHLTEVQSESLNAIVREGFYDTEDSVINTRAVVVLFKGQLAAEHYAQGFDKDSRLLGWSMTKSIVSTLLGGLADQELLDIASSPQIDIWQADERKHITWEHLLHMNSGLQWDENYGEVSAAVNMLFDSDNAGKYAAQSAYECAPGSYWEYSSGTTNILSYAMQQFFDSKEAYIRYPYNRFFHRIGMYSMVMEVDAMGGFIGSSFSYATARDWARLGQLYLNEGTWAGERVLSREWIDFVRQEAPNSNGAYGGHFWLNKGSAYSNVARDAYWMDGFHGQTVVIVPSKELVIVRLGLDYYGNFDFNNWIANIITTVEPAVNEN